MQTFEVRKTNDFAVFKQVVRGAYNPVTITKSNCKSALFLVRTANTCVVCSAANQIEAEQYITATDLTAFGYHSTSDIEIKYTHNSSLKNYQAVISPKIVYPLSEDISLPEPLDEKCEIFTDFISDEFERVKLRAEHIMYGAFPDEKIRSFAIRNLQLLRKLYHDSRISFNKLCSGSGRNVRQSDLYILYTLNLFIIRCIVFYTKFFRPYLNEVPPIEQDLRNNFHSEMPRILKYPWLFVHRPPLYEVLEDYGNTSAVCELNQQYQKAMSLKPSEIPEELLKEALEVIKLKGCIQLTGPRNAFLAEIYKMRYDKDKSGKTMVTGKRNKLIKLLAFAVLDDEGNTLNENTINTDLKPANVEKRPGV